MGVTREAMFCGNSPVRFHRQCREAGNPYADFPSRGLEDSLNGSCVEMENLYGGLGSGPDRLNLRGLEAWPRCPSRGARRSMGAWSTEEEESSHEVSLGVFACRGRGGRSAARGGLGPSVAAVARSRAGALGVRSFSAKNLWAEILKSLKLSLI